MFKKLWNSNFVALFAKGVVLGKEMEFTEQRRYVEPEIT